MEIEEQTEEQKNRAELKQKAKLYNMRECAEEDNDASSDSEPSEDNLEED